jgi:hypothetical protein
MANTGGIVAALPLMSRAWHLPPPGVPQPGLGTHLEDWGCRRQPQSPARPAPALPGTPPPWENYGVVTSAQGATNAWGDWYSSR